MDAPQSAAAYLAPPSPAARRIAAMASLATARAAVREHDFRAAELYTADALAQLRALRGAG